MLVMWKNVSEKGTAEKKEYFLLSFSFFQCHLSFCDREKAVKRRKDVDPLLLHIYIQKTVHCIIIIILVLFVCFFFIIKLIFYSDT
jgi:hypothetical protein